MFYEKIKIYVTKSVNDVLMRDADLFGFKKTDGITTNKNAFFTALILNYHDDFASKQSTLHTKVEKILKTTNLNATNLEFVKNEIVKSFNNEISSSHLEKYNVLVSIKPTKETAGLISYAENYLLNGLSLSEYFRNMFTSYTLLPQDKRAQLIFKKQYLEIEKAISENKKVYITTSGNNGMEFSPYALSRSKEEFHTYVLGKSKSCPFTIKLSNVSSATILNQPRELDEKDCELFEKMMKYGPQFAYSLSDTQTVLKLTKTGEIKYKKFYVHRPVACKIEGDTYYFDCSSDQVFQYFIKFGKDATFISPNSIRKRATYFLTSTLSNYRKHESKDK